MQGDLLYWLLSAALTQDSARNHAALAHARARDELLMATMELRERAMALHLHIPHKFTLNTKRERVDVRAGWADTISRVEQVGTRTGTSCFPLLTLQPLRFDRLSTPGRLAAHGKVICAAVSNREPHQLRPGKHGLGR